MSRNVQAKFIYDQPLSWSARIILSLLLIPILLSFTQPLWRIFLRAPQYPNGLRLDIYSYMIVGGNGGQDINEINELNHYIGMRKLNRSQFADLDWIPFAWGILGLLTLRQAVLGNVRGMIDLVVLTIYVSLFAFARYVYRLYIFGHDLDPHAPVRIQPFMPVIIGRKQLANFTTYGIPMWGSGFLAVFVAGVIAVTVWQFLSARRASAAFASPRT